MKFQISILRPCLESMVNVPRLRSGLVLSLSKDVVKPPNIKKSFDHLYFSDSPSDTKSKLMKNLSSILCLGFEIFTYIVICFIFCLLRGFELHAETLNYFESKEIEVIIGEAKPLRVSNPRQVKIGNPDILDVVGAGANELLLSGLKEGETILTVVDDFGKTTYTVKIFLEDLEKLKERVDILLKAAGFDKLTTQIGEKERKIFILGEVPASKKDSLDSKLDLVKDKIVNLIEYYEDIPSVEIDVEVLEIEKTALDNLGFEWNKSIAFSEGSVSDDLSELVHPRDFFKVLKDWRTGTFSTTLNFLKQRNKARTLSRPKLVCLSGKEAKLLVGGERPIISGSTTSTTASGTTTDYEIELKEYGITLTIKPVVRENNEIQVALRTEITEIDDSQSLSIGTTTTPGFTKRSAQTELTVMSGQIVFIAGLIKSKLTDSRDGIAGLSSIPFFGALFRHKDLDKRDTEIVITLTPTIIRNKPLRGASSQAVVKASTTSQSYSRGQTIEPVEIYHIEEDDPVISYSNLIQDIINSNIEYPQELKDKKVEGAVKLSLHLLPTGKLLGVIIIQSSGNQLLDEAAEYTVKKLSPFPAFPSELKLKELWVNIPIVYEAGNRV